MFSRIADYFKSEKKQPSPQDSTSWLMTVLVKDTNPKEGICGHVSVMAEEISNNGHTKKTTHTSMEPSVGLVNILSIPVSGLNATDIEADKKQADFVFKRQLTKAEYEKVVERQIQFDNDVKNGKTKYSFAGHNLVSSLFNSIMHTGPSQSRHTITNHWRNTWVDPTADVFGTEVADHRFHVDVEPPQLENCATSSFSILRSIGIDDKGTCWIPSHVKDFLLDRKDFNCEKINKDTNEIASPSQNRHM